jgi:hypothetical protein
LKESFGGNFFSKQFSNSEEKSPQPSYLEVGSNRDKQINRDQFSETTVNKYETPTFIHKNEKISAENSSSSEQVQTIPNFENDPLSMNLKQNVENDIKTIMGQFDNSLDKNEKIKQLKDGREKLSEESKKISAQVEADIQDLLSAKESSIRLSNLLNLYQSRLTKDGLSKLRLSDEVTLKNLLRDKLQREMQGFRTSPGEYAELNQVNPDDITSIIHEIKMKLNN